MKISKETLNAIDSLITELSAPALPIEIESGWDQESKHAIKKYFDEIREGLYTNSSLPSLNVIRGLDHWGISSGDLFKRIVLVTRKLKEESTSGK